MDDFSIFGTSSGGGLTSEPEVEIVMSIEGDSIRELVPGFTIEARIETNKVKDSLLLPVEAMRKERDEYFVFVVKDNNEIEKVVFTLLNYLPLYNQPRN